MLPFGSFSHNCSTQVPTLLVILVFLVFPRVPLFLACCLGGMKFLQGEGSMVIHCKKNYLLYKDATCHNLWPCDFTDVTAFSSLLFLALHYCFFLYIFFLLWLFLWLFKFFTKFFFMVVSFFFKGIFLPECCFFWLFLRPTLPSSSWWCFFLARSRLFWLVLFWLVLHIAFA